MVRLIGKLDDISKQKAREEQQLFQFTRDGLTGVYNKTAFEYVMEETLKKGSRGYLYMIDIDNFKDVNDRYGHPAGDIVGLGRSKRAVLPAFFVAERVNVKMRQFSMVLYCALYYNIFYRA